MQKNMFDFDDYTTSEVRLSNILVKRNKVRKFFGAIILLGIMLCILSIALNKIVDAQIKGVELRNLTVYGDPTGFRPVK